MSDTVPVDDLPDGLLVADDRGRVVTLNRTAGRLLGLPPGDAVGRDYRTVCPLTDTSGRDWWACTDPYQGLRVRTGQPERLLLLGTGGPAARPVYVTARYLRHGPGLRRLVVSLRDATGRERQERQAADLVSTVSHELRSPLTSVKGFTATLLARWDRFTDEQKKLMLATINADADRVTRLIGELLDVSRIDAGRVQLHRAPVDLPQLVDRVVAGRVAAGEPADRFTVRVQGQPAKPWADPDKLQQVLANLVENAVRHGAGQVTVTVAAADGGVALCVADEGEGVPAELAPQLFTRFWRGNRGGGSGLGLYITKGLVEAHGGSVRVDRAPGGGALFAVHLPVGDPPGDGAR